MRERRGHSSYRARTCKMIEQGLDGVDLERASGRGRSLILAHTKKSLDSLGAYAVQMVVPETVRQPIIYPCTCIICAGHKRAQRQRVLFVPLHAFAPDQEPSPRILSLPHLPSL